MLTVIILLLLGLGLFCTGQFLYWLYSSVNWSAKKQEVVDDFRKTHPKEATVEAVKEAINTYKYEVTYTPKDPENKWLRVVDYFNRYYANISTRQAFLTEMFGKPQKSFPKETIYDQYRCYLQKAGYIESYKRGNYVRVKEIPHDLTTKQCRREAYGK